MKVSLSTSRYVAALFAASLSLMAAAHAAAPPVSATISADRSGIFMREDFYLTLTIVSSGVRLSKTFNLQSLPSETVLQRLGGFQELPIRRTQKDGHIREVRSFRCKARATRAGQMRISPILQVGTLARRNSFWGPVWKETRHNIRVSPLSIAITPLPETGRPPDFSGAIGRFVFDVQVTPSDVVVGDLVTATMRIVGQGYLDDVQIPAISPGRHFKAYEPKPVASGKTGELLFKQTLVPQSTNAVAVSSVSFCYFDPRRAQYKTITRGPFPLAFHPPREVTREVYQSPAATPRKKQTDAAKPSPARIQEAPFRQRAAIAGYWALLTLFGLWLASRGRRGLIAAGALLLCAVLAFPSMQSAVKTMLSERPQTTVIRSEKARLAPSHNAVSTFVAPKGACVRVVETCDFWTKIALDSNKGWIPSDALKIRGLHAPPPSPPDS